MSARGALPAESVTLVHYPGIVRDVPRAVATLGGAAALSDALRGDGAEVHLRYRPGDPLAHPVVGTVTSKAEAAKSGLLLRLGTRKRPRDPQGQGAGDEVEAKVVARVERAVNFNGMADFQYVTNRDSMPSLGEPHSGRGAPWGEDQQEMMVVPPLFSRDDLPNDYAFRAARVPHFGRKQTAVKNKALLVVSWNAQTHPVPKQMQHVGHTETTLDRKLQDLLSRRPIWTPSFLAKHFNTTPKAELEAAVHRACYCFRIGPWRGLLIRRGLDPRQDPSCRQWQGVSYQYATNWHETPGGKALLDAARKRKEEGAEPHEVPARRRESAWPAEVEALVKWIPQPDVLDVLSFQALPVPKEGQIVLQPTDLGSKEIQDIMAAPSEVESCHSRYGWLPSEAVAELERLTTEKLHTLLQGNTVELHKAAQLMEVRLPEERPPSEGGEPEAAAAAGHSEVAEPGGHQQPTGTRQESVLADVSIALLEDGDEFQIYEDDEDEDENEDENEDEDEDEDEDEEEVEGAGLDGGGYAAMAYGLAGRSSGANGAGPRVDHQLPTGDEGDSSEEEEEEDSDDDNDDDEEEEEEEDEEEAEGDEDSYDSDS